MKSTFKRVKDVTRNVMVHGAQSVLGSVHFVAVSVAVGAEQVEAGIVKRSFGQLSEVTIRDRRLKTTKRRQEIIDGYNHLKLMLGDMANIGFTEEEDAINEAIEHGNA